MRALTELVNTISWLNRIKGHTLTLRFADNGNVFRIERQTHTKAGYF